MLLLLLLVFACKENNQEREKPVEAQPVKTEKAEPEVKASTADVDTVIIKQMRFQPEEVRIRPGQKIVWVNKDIVAHDVTEDEDKWTSGTGNMEPGDVWEKTFDESYDYHCSIHPTMKGKIIVAEE